MHQVFNTSPKICHVTSVAKELDPSSHFNGFENVDWDMQLAAYQNEGVRHLSAAIAVAWCAEEHLTTLAAYLKGNGGGAWMSGSLQVQGAPMTLNSNNIAPYVNRETVLKMFPWLLSNSVISLKITLSSWRLIFGRMSIWPFRLKLSPKIRR
jgi:hypothetical protein